ncbi:MAG: DOMON-like domain-containing protein [Betaproteobacteria bacterium]
MADVALLLHPSSSSPVRTIRVSVGRTAGVLSARYRIEGDLARVRVPPPAAARRVDGLWRHTCCELFVSWKGSAAYQEFNFSPSGEWAAYAFDSYRKPGGNLDLEPRMEVRRTDVFELDAEILATGTDIGVCAVIEDTDGALSYWALRHPAGKPDFHHRDAFALELE